MALVVALVMIVLVTAIILAFYTYATANHQIEDIRADQTEADQLVHSAGNYVIQQFLQEIATNANSSPLTNNSVVVYRPLTNINTVPIRAISTGISSTSSTFFNLIRQSVPPSAGGVDANSSTDNTGTPSQNGRAVSLVEWNLPHLLTGAGFASTSQLPNWIYVNGITGISSTIGTGTIGRFAYNVYDIGGLLDANVAGYASTESTELPTPAKGSLSGAVLTNIVTKSAVDTLIANRNPGSGGIYTNIVATFDQQNGFLYPTVTNSAGLLYTNNFFLSRQDLIRYAQTNDNTLNNSLTNALPYLTTFSRALNAPSWGPEINTANTNGTTYNYWSLATNPASTNPFVPNVRVQTTGTFTHYNDDGTSYTYAVNAGQPLVQHRFSLAKLAWLTHTGPSATAFNSSLTSAQQNAAIQACFGLAWTNGYPLYNTGGTPPTVNGWMYTGSDASNTSTIESTIETLNTVAANNREPNFFELLQTGILNGSMGQSYYYSSPFGTYAGNNNALTKGMGWADNTNTYYHIIRIGANIIDQYKSDSYPTALIFGQTGANGTPTPTYTFWGMEDLPYLDSVGWICYEPQMPNGKAQSYMIYQLWNPHQISNSQARPVNFRIRMNANGLSRVTYVDNANGATNEVFPYVNGFTGMPTNPVTFTINSAAQTGGNTLNNYREPHVLRQTTGTGAGSYIGTTNSPFAIYCNALQLAPPNTNTITWTNSAVYGNNYDFNLESAVVALDYQDTTGSWTPYTTYIGHEENFGATGLGGTNGLEIGQWAYPTNTAGYGAPTATTNSWHGFVKTDPRTFRFEAGDSYQFDTNLAPTAIASAPTGIGFDGWFNGAEKPATFAANTKANGAGTYYPDNDGIVRPGDSGVNNGNPFQYSVNTYRPIILNRPFQSVAEMGYAFRDLPFKTLDFSSSSSADAGLLDLFSLNDEPAIGAGKLALNSRQAVTQQSMLSLGTNSLGVTGYGITNAATIASAFNNYAYTSTSLAPTAAIPETMADFASFIGSSNYAMPPIKAYREAPVQALTGAVQSRTWNLLIDVIAQTGRNPNGGSTGSGFLVQAEKHYWVSVAIDRYTGQIVDEQVEYVNE